MLLALSPDATLLLLTAGVLLVYLECNRPGMILPGATGLTLSLLAVARLVHLSMPRSSAQACFLAAALLALSVRLPVRGPAGFSARVALAGLSFLSLLFGFDNVTLPASGTRRHLFITILCALFLGPGTSLLTTIAARARQNKGLDPFLSRRRV